MADLETGDYDEPGMTRRTLIKRSAIVGGTVLWAAPVVQSFTSPAFGQVGTPAGKDFSYLAFFYNCGHGPQGVKFELNDDGSVSACEASAAPNTPGCTLTPPSGASAGDCSKFNITKHFDGSITVTFKELGICTFIASAGVGKCGNPNNPSSGGACIEGVVAGNTLTFAMCLA